MGVLVLVEVSLGAFRISASRVDVCSLGGELVVVVLGAAFGFFHVAIVVVRVAGGSLGWTEALGFLQIPLVLRLWTFSALGRTDGGEILEDCSDVPTTTTTGGIGCRATRMICGGGPRPAVLDLKMELDCAVRQARAGVS
jgi:hypothetical protein